MRGNGGSVKGRLDDCDRALVGDGLEVDVSRSMKPMGSSSIRAGPRSDRVSTSPMRSSACGMPSGGPRGPRAGQALARQAEDVWLDLPEDAAQASSPLEPGAVAGSLTRTGEVLGTLGYMPLEQLEGKRTDARSDQWSFCASLYEIQPCGSRATRYYPAFG